MALIVTDAIAAIMNVKDNAGNVATAQEDSAQEEAMVTAAIPITLGQPVAAAALVAHIPAATNAPNVAATTTTMEVTTTTLGQPVATAALVAHIPVAANAPNAAAAATTTMETVDQIGAAGAAEAIMEIMDGEIKELLFVLKVLNP